MADNTIIAAHLAAALIVKSQMQQTPEQAVERYRSVLKLLDDADASAKEEGTAGWLGAVRDENSRP
jgi:hypothetical protein